MPLRAGRPHDEKGVHVVDTLADDERGVSNVHTLGGTQQVAVQHVPGEWRGVESVSPPGGATRGTTDVPPTGVQFRTRLLALTFKSGYPRRIFGSARPENWGRLPPPF